MMGYGGCGVGAGGFGMIIFWVLGILAIVWVLREVSAGRIGSRGSIDPSAAPPQDSALAILRDRYARGEIDEDEFERRKRSL
jgi:putative membrane protein